MIENINDRNLEQLSNAIDWDIILEAIAENLTPIQVFDSEQLGEWATENGFTKAE